MRNKLIMKYPASWHGDMWREAIPVGNGEIGGLVYGAVHKEFIGLIHGKLWWKSKTDSLPDVSDTLPEIRKLLDENESVKARTIMADALKSKGYNPDIGRPLPLCDLSVLMHNEKGFKKYLRELDMECGEASVSWNEGESRFYRRFFISRVNDTACYKIDVDGEAFINADLSLVIHDVETKGQVGLPQNNQSVAGGGYLKYAAENDDGSDFGAVACIKHDGEAKYRDGIAYITNARSITVFIKVFINGDRNQAWVELEKGFDNILTYDHEFKQHTTIHSKLYNSLKVDLGGDKYELSNEELLLEAYQGESPIELIEKMWSFGRYLLISASREGGYPCHLYGLWTGTYSGMWAFNMYNVNLEMIYWQALSGNMPDMLMPVFDYVESMMGDYRENSKKLYGCRGINISSVSTPESGLHKRLSAHILHWTGAAGWISQHYFDYYLHTGDIDFLRNRAMPFMYEAALFYEDFLIVDENGYFVSSPSNSPENKPVNFKNPTLQSDTAINATMDFAIVKELLNNLIKGAVLTQSYCENIDRWKEMLTRIPPYQLNSEGAVKEWMHPFFGDNYEHRHQSHVYPIFPGTEVTKYNNPELYKGFVKAMQKRKVLGLKDQSGWSLTYMSNVFARMGEGDVALECLDFLSRSNIMSNFVTVHNDWRRMGIAVCGDLRFTPVQIDANMGFTATIQEMAIFSTEDEIFAFNAIPKKWEKGIIGPLLTRTNSEVILSWDKKSKLAKLSIKQLSTARKFNIILPENAIFTSNEKNIIESSLMPGDEVVFEVNLI